MGFNINEFSSHLNSKKLAKSSLFDVRINRPFSPDTGIERDLTMRCIATDLPGSNINTLDHSYAGPTHKIATGSSFLDQNFSILLSEDMSEKKYFEEWKTKIVGNYSTGQMSPNMFNIGYYSEYIGSVVITTYKETGEKSYSVKLHEAFPIMINSMPLAWATTDFLVLPVTFAFRFYTEETV